MTGIIEFSSDTLNIEVSGINQNIPIDLVEVIFTGQDIYIDVENSNGVSEVNGRAGFVTLNKSDVGLENVENISIVSTSGYLQDQINQLDTGYTSQSEFNLLSGNLTERINLLSGYVEEENILVFTAELPSGEETAFLTYPFSLGSSPSSITCSFQNTIDNVIYTYTIGQITQSGFYANFSDILTNSGYLLKVKVKK